MLDRGSTEESGPMKIRDRSEMDCPMAGLCPIFDDFESQAALRIWQINYCEKKFERCARYQVRQTGEYPPRTLLPDGSDASEAD